MLRQFHLQEPPRHQRVPRSTGACAPAVLRSLLLCSPRSCKPRCCAKADSAGGHEGDLRQKKPFYLPGACSQGRTGARRSGGSASPRRAGHCAGAASPQERVTSRLGRRPARRSAAPSRPPVRPALPCPAQGGPPWRSCGGCWPGRTTRSRD